MRRYLYLATGFWLLPALAWGQSIAAAWDPNPPSDQITSYDVCISTTSLTCNVERASVPATETSYAFTPTPGVLYRIAVRAVNASGAGAYSPEIVVSIPSLAQPANQTSTVNTPITALNLSASDPDGSTLQFAHSGLPFGLSISSSTGRITGTPTSAGTYNVTVFVSDNLETTTRTFVWTVQGSGDSTQPSLSVTSHTSGQSVTTSSITLAGTASDSGSGGSGITSVTVNGSSATGGTASGSNTANWSRSVSLSTGSNTLTVVATDGAGNTRTSTLTITRASSDTAAPALSVTSHTSGQSVTTSSITLAGTASDSGSGGNGITSVRVNGSNATGGTASGNGTANWSRSVSLSTGANTLSVVATDGSGNARTVSLTINRTVAPDTTAPTVNVTSHASGQTAATSLITLAGTATDSGSGGSGITGVTVNGSAAAGGTASGNGVASWSRTLTLGAGPNVISVAATDGAGNVRTTSMTVVGPVPPMTSAFVTPNLSSPRTAGTTITLTGGGAGGATPYAFKWWVQKDGGAWSQLQDWTSNSITWTPTQAGSYVIGVWGRSAGVSTDVAQAIGTLAYQVTQPTSTTPPPSQPPSSSQPSGQATSATLSANRTSPQNAGATTTLSATASGGAAPYSFKWWFQLNGGTWTQLADWSTSTSLDWRPTAAGNYVLGVWARSAGATADTPQALATLPFTVNGTSVPTSPSSPSAAPSVVIGADRISPQTAGTRVVFTASGSGGSSPYSYKWWAQLNGGTWTMLQDWSTGTSFSWTPAAAGSYVVGVWARSAGSTQDTPQAIGTMNFNVTTGTSSPAPPPVSVAPSATVTPSLSSPRGTGTTVTFSANMSGGTEPYSYKFWVQRDGGAWTMMRDWSTSSGWSWTPTLTGNYMIGVWVRSAGAVLDTPQAIATVPYVVMAGTAPSSTLSASSNNVRVGAFVTLSAGASGLGTPNSFKWWVQKDGGAWVELQGWSTSSTYTWRPSSPGIYVLGVWARAAGMTADTPQAIATTPVVVNP